MSRETVLIILGALVALAPYSGLPLWLLGVVLPVLGLVLIGLGVLARVEKKRSAAGMAAAHTATEAPGTAPVAAAASASVASPAYEANRP